MKSPVHIVAAGLRTPLGLSPAPCAAAVRAGVSRLSFHPTLVDRLGEPMVAAMDPLLDPGLAGPARFVALAESALRSVLARLPKGLAPRLPLYLALPEHRPGFGESDVTHIAKALPNLPELPCEVLPVHTFARGHAGGVLALEAGMAAIERGEEACLVGGVESYFSEETMTWLDGHRQLAGSDGRSSFVPGEGAAFLLLTTQAGARRLGLTRQASIVSLGTAAENALIKTPALCLGEGLTAAVQRAVATLGTSRKINDILCDINGERYRTEEWGFVCLRIPQYFDEPASYRAPADLWGDMGAASVPLLAVLACEARARSYARGTLSLLWASSEGGQRGAVVLDVTETLPQGGRPAWQA